MLVNKQIIQLEFVFVCERCLPLLNRLKNKRSALHRLLPSSPKPSLLWVCGPDQVGPHSAWLTEENEIKCTSTLLDDVSLQRNY